MNRGGKLPTHVVVGVLETRPSRDSKTPFRFLTQMQGAAVGWLAVYPDFGRYRDFPDISGDEIVFSPLDRDHRQLYNCYAWNIPKKLVF